MADNSDDLLDQWLNFNEEEGGESAGSEIPKAGKRDSYPLSQTQKRLWLVYQKLPTSPVYNYSEIWTFPKNDFKADALKESLSYLVRKHQVLGSNYVIVDEEPRIVFPERRAFSFTQSIDNQESYKWLKSQASKAFRLESDPLVRVAVIEGDQQTQVGITFHHIVIDAWSLGIIKDDFAKVYSELIQGNHPEPIDEESIQFVDFACWEEERIDEEPDSEFNLDAFQTEPLDLPLDKTRPSSPSYEGRLFRFNLSKELTPKLQKLCSDLQTTEFNVMLTAFQILLSKYGKADSVNIGIPVLSRKEEELKSIVGYFVDTQVLGTKVEPKASFLDLLNKVKGEVLSAITGEKPSYEQLLASSPRLPDQSINPLFQAMFVGHSHGDNPFKAYGLAIESETLDLDASKFDLTLHHFGEKDGSFGIGVEISSDLFKPVFADRLFQHFEALLSGICVNADAKVSELSLISRAENDYLKSGLSHGLEIPSDGNFVQDLETIFDRETEKTALVCGDQSISYAELKDRSNSIVAELDRRGVDRNNAIGIYMNRSVDYVVAMVGIMRYGGYYLPLDPEYPEGRISQYLEESKCAFVLTTQAESIFDNKDIEIIEINSIENNQIIDNQLNKISSKLEFAYLIFTSGSTSKPKGVRISHSNLHSSIDARRSYYKEAPESYLVVSSFSFDSSVAGIFWTLATGGKLVISQDNESLDAKAISRLIERENVTHTLMLPSLYQAILESNASTSLSHVIVAGEECPTSLIVKHFEHNPSGHLYNEYGPTEGTVWCTVHEFNKGQKFARAPIGLATSNTSAYILDENLELQPTGLPGELCIAGPGIAEGYFGLEGQDEKFVKNPYSDEWRTIYRTGDLVRLQADGLIEYLGRADNQVKIRGHRIELNEIQNLSESHTVITKSVAFVTSTEPQRISLAYQSEEELENEEIRELLELRLPSYMVPELYLYVKDFPLLPNGKIDVKALEKELNDRPPESNQIVSKQASTYLQQQVANIWADVLGLDEVAVNADFNALGGNSLQSIRIIARCRDIGLKVTPAQFLRYSTVESLVNSVHHEEYHRPENTLQLEVLKVWEKHLSQKLIGIKDSFEKDGGSSFEWERVEGELEAKFGPKNTFSIKDTIASISSTLDSTQEIDNQKVKRIIPITTIGDKKPLFCVHSEFYYETVYSQLTRHLSADYPVYGLLSVSPELVKDEVPEDIPAIAKLCIEDMKKVQEEGTYRILSYSIGNVVAFEMAKQLIQAGEKVQLIMIDPPLFFDKSRVFGKGGYKKLFTHLELWKKPATFLNKIKKKVNKEKKPALIEDTGLLKKYLLQYKPERLEVDTLLITTPSEFKHTYGWDPLLKVVDTERIQGPHLKLMREPYASQMNDAIERNLRKWDEA